MPPPLNSTRKRAFSLIEAAIVLGVIGLVVGGIWVAAQSVAQANRRTEITAMFLEMKQRLVQKSYGNDFGANAINLYAWTPILYSDTKTHPDRSTYYGLTSYSDQAKQGASGLWYSAVTSAGTLYSLAVAGLNDADCKWVLMNIQLLTDTRGSSVAPDTFIGNATASTNQCCVSAATTYTNLSPYCTGNHAWIAFRRTRDWN